MLAKLRVHIRHNVVGYVALFVALTGTAYAVDGPLPGQNQVGSSDIINGEVRNDDLGVDAVGSTKIADRSVKNADLSVGASSSNTIADGGIQGVDVKGDTLTGAQVAESTLFNDNSLTDGDVDESTLFNDNSLTGADVAESSLGTVPDAHTVGGIDSANLVKGGGEILHDRSDVDPGSSDIIDIGLGFVQLNCQANGQYALFYWHQSAAVGGMDVWWKNLDGVGYQRVVNLGPSAQLTPFSQRADIVTVHTGWTADWTPSQLFVISARFDSTANKCIAIYRSTWSLN
jgi:hypothetical protein